VDRNSLGSIKCDSTIEEVFRAALFVPNRSQKQSGSAK